MIQARAVEASGRERRMSEGKMCIRCAVYTMQFMVVLFYRFFFLPFPPSSNSPAPSMADRAA